MGKRMIEEITVDIDENFDEWKHGIGYLTLMARLENVFYVKTAYARRSSNNHVHVMVKFYRGITPFNSFLVRAYLDDDPHRLACDLSRLYESHRIDQTGRCFDEKYSRGKLKKAGAWMRL